MLQISASNISKNKENGQPLQVYISLSKYKVDFNSVKIEKIEILIWISTNIN